MKSFAIPFFCLATIINSEAFSEETKKIATKYAITSNKITVIATKNPQNAFEVPLTTAKVDMSETQYKNSTTVADIFANTPGIEIEGGPVRNAQQFSMRGYDANGIIFLLDGTRQNFKGGHLTNIFLDPSLIKQVEVVKGSSSAIYGSGGLGGVISFETKDAKDMLKEGQKLGFMQKVGYFSANHEKSSTSSIYAADDKIDVVASITARDAGTLNLGGGQKFKFADSRVKSGMMKLNVALTDEQKLKLSVQGYDNSSTELSNPQSEASSSSAFPVSKQAKSSTIKLGYSYKPENNKLVDFSTQVYRVDNEINYTTLTRVSSSTPLGADRAQTIGTTGFDIQNVSTFDKNEKLTNRLTYGLNYFEDTQTSNNQGTVWNLVPKGQSKVGGIFLQNEMQAKTNVGQFSVIPSVRYDEYRSNATGYSNVQDSAVSPRLAIGYMPTKWLNIFSNVGRAFRAPTSSERYTSGSHYPGNTFIASPNLKAEKNTTYEGGVGLNFEDVAMKSDSFQIKGTYFYTKAKDYIGQFTTNGGINTQYLNVNGATIKGVDATAEYRTPKVTATVGYNYTTGKDDATNQYLQTILPHTVKTNLAYNFTKATAVGFRSTFAKTLNNVNTSSDKKSGYAVHDIYAQYDHKDTFAVSFAVNNMFNTKYYKPYTVLPQLGRDYRVTLSYKY